ncbi:hypothetical protein BKH44_02555 [Helicobacter sp. 13S00477-4]|nr:hypothetical protein BKH44_02555 [Helicobacter sp. 13S00477-4]
MLNVILSASLISFFITIIIKFFSNRFHIFIDKIDEKKPQKMHIISTPRAGGVGIFFGFSLVLLSPEKQYLYFFIALTIIFLSGLLEDFFGSLGPKTRLSLQLIGCSVAIFGLDAIITNLSPVIILPYWIGIVFSLFGIIGVCNAINIIDGFNGLSSGICLMVFTTIGFAAFSVDSNFVLFVSIIAIGSTLGFFVLNFPKGKIFLGDGGAYMLGFIIAILLAILTQSDSNISAWFGLAVMIYPVWEVLFSIIRRIKNKQPAMHPDKKHLHTLIYHKIHNNPLTAVFIWLLNLPFMILSIIFMHKAWVLICICIGFIIIYNMIYLYLKSQIKAI